PGGVTKILWRLPRAGSMLTLTGKRLDGSGTFVEHWPTVGGGAFPSILDVPQEGCWSLSLRSGKARAVVIVRAIEPKLQEVCEPTPIVGDAATARPTTSGIAGV